MNHPQSRVPGKTIAEKILSAKSSSDARAGDVVVCRLDHLMATDGSMPMTIDYFERMGGNEIVSPERIVVALDHYSPAPNRQTATLHDQIRAFCGPRNITVYNVGDGIGHQLALETGRALPGSLIIGADSHTVTCGGLNAFATGVGSSDLAAAMISGEIWLRVPETIHVELTGALQDKVHCKDVSLALVGRLGADGATYQALEFGGPAVPAMTIDDRALLANLSVEMGAKCGIFPADEVTYAYLEGRSDTRGDPTRADGDAVYSRRVTLDLSSIAPQIAMPHRVDNVVPITEAGDVPIHMVYIGTCAGGRTSDLHEALEILRTGDGFAASTQVIFTPASRDIFREVSSDGSLAEFIGMGGIVQSAGCGSCCGTCGAIPGDGVNVISTANRNFKGRMGNANASIYLASPASCAAAALHGRITDPRSGTR